DGSALAYSAILGGWAAGLAIAVDQAGSAYVTGYASSAFPTTPGAAQATFGKGVFDAFVTKLNPQGTAPVYSTFLGGVGGGTGSIPEQGKSIAVDAQGNVYVTGSTQCVGFPQVNPPSNLQIGVPTILFQSTDGGQHWIGNGFGGAF